MSTGSLKFLSLLLVIAAGGGVAWQAQRGIQHPLTSAQSTAEDEEDADDLEDEEPSDDLLAESEPTIELEPPHQRKIAAAGFEDDQFAESDSSEQPQSIPNKFQRSPEPAKSHGAPIPIRTAALPNDDADDSSTDSTGTADNADADDDPFSSEEPTPIAKRSRGKTLTPVPETDSSDDDTLDSEDGEMAETASENADSSDTDPFDASSPVLLVGKEEPEKRARRRTPAAAQDRDLEIDAETTNGADSTEDDPFAGAAPPDTDESQPSSLPTKLEPLDFGSDPDESQPSIAIPPLEAEEEKPQRTPRPAPPARETSDDTFGSDPGAEEPALKLGSPSARPPATPDAEVRETPRVKDTPIRSRRSPPRTKEPANEKTPRLLPVPDNKSDETFPSLPTELDEQGPAELDAKPSRQRPSTDDLRGDGTPDHNAPKGLQQPRLTIEKIAPKQAILGQPLVYSVVVKNAGSADAHQVTVEDRIPKGTELQGTSPRAEMVDKRLIWKLGTLKPDEQKKISIKVVPQEQGPIGSVARVNFVAEIAAEIEVTAPQILVSVESPSQVRLGDKLPLVFKIRNAGSADAENIIVRNLIPEGLRHPAGADLEYAMGKLPAQESREVRLELIATKNGKIVNKTLITGDGGISLEEETPVEVVGEQLLLTRTGKNRLYVDKPTVFTSTVANEGTAPANKVMVAEIVPVGFEFVSASDNGKFDPSTRAVTWSVGPIAPGEELKISTKLTPKHLGDHRATVTVTGPAGSVATVDAQMKVDGFPAVAVDSKSDTRLISIGEKAKVRISCKNQGTAAAKNVVLSAQLPPELRLVNGQGPTAWKQEGNVVTFEPIASLDPDETATFDVQVAGEQEGDTRIELQISADHLTRPLHRDETIRVAPESE